MTVHVIGAGMAGLVSAWELAKQGLAVQLHEASPLPGGRARALPDGTDNGTHALLGANPAALAFLEEIGARNRWFEPEPQALPVYDLARDQLRHVALSPLLWRQPAWRPAGLGPAALLRLLTAALPGQRGSVARHFRRQPVLLRDFIEPLTLATLNTAPAEASLARLGSVLRRLAAPGATRLLLPRSGLGPDLLQPALDALHRQGAAIRFGARLRGITREDGRAAALDFSTGEIRLAPGDQVVLATPPWESVRLMPQLRVPASYAPVLNLHLRHATGQVSPRFIGLLGGVSHWLLARPDSLSVTISAADAVLHEEGAALAARIWGEIRRAALAVGLPGPWPEAPPPWRLVKEHRATPAHLPGMRRPPGPRLLPNLVLAGDWTDPALPATLEAAARSGRRAARALRS